ncbi:GNAT family N-acetyltransferase [Pendulispora rubella]|uniref:GNAT family N-acetyltransferase n=1 Tax=Pendulispora rubella TaxID=2741070 RepID=A0ABZ2KSS4_9BACT
MDLAIRPVTPDLWPVLEDLFGKSGASNGCWCMYWRIGSLYRQRPREENKKALRQLVKRGPPPGLLAFDGDTAVGWCQLTSRDDLPWLDRGQFARVDDMPVWAISCFYIRRGHRKRGVTGALIEAALKAAKTAGAPAVEAYPWDASKSVQSDPFTGFLSTFERLGFREIARRRPARPVMRYDFASAGGRT